MMQRSSSAFQVLFANRAEAGRELARRLRDYAERDDVTVLALPRGGVPVAAEIARLLRLPLDVFVVRKIGVPGYEELALAAIASGGATVINTPMLRTLGLDVADIEAVARRESLEVIRRERLYRKRQLPIQAEGRAVILVDDGLATGATMRAAILALRARKPAKIVVAVPVGAPDTCRDLEGEADEVVCVRKPDPFYGVGVWYGDFAQTTDDEVCELLESARRRNGDDR
jgi:predicted phosphoribosyltransferase